MEGEEATGDGGRVDGRLIASPGLEWHLLPWDRAIAYLCKQATELSERGCPKQKVGGGGAAGACGLSR